jgi:hypothetical protein
MKGNYAYSQKVAAFNQMRADMANRMAAIHGTIAGKYDQLTKNPRKPLKSLRRPISAACPRRKAFASEGREDRRHLSGPPRDPAGNGKRMVEQ